MGLLVAGLLAGSVAAAGMTPAHAVRTTGWADWDPLAGSANDYSTTVHLPANGFPAASVSSDSRAGGVGVQSGSSVWFGPTTPVGAKYGSSQNRPYLNLRPLADTATTPSTTTYTFDHPTPPTGWTFVLGDIDADQVKVDAKDADGQPVTAAQLGFVQGFNLCDSSPRPGGCSVSVGDVPTWNPATRTLVGNAAATDTFGASGWFEPTVSLSTLTFTFTRRSGFPVYQTWFASVARTISGTVTQVGAGGCPVTDVTVRLVGPHGEQLATTTPDATGAYSFGQYATQPGYVVSVEPPATCAVVGPESVTVSTAASDATADFQVRQIIPQAVSGRVVSDGTTPLAGVTVTLHLPGGGTRTTTTEADGSYLFDNNAAGTGYFVSIDVPDGYAGNDQLPPFDIATDPIVGQNFDLTAFPDVSGNVTGGGNGLGGVTVTLTPTGGGPSISTVTQGDGSYTFERTPPGTYDISIDTPSGYTPEPPLTGVVVAGVDVPNQDFALERPGALGGTVHLDTGTGAGSPGVTIEITGPGGTTTTLVTDSEGDYFLDQLPSGDYLIRVVLPTGFEIVGPLVHTVTITDAGEIRSGEDFVITQATAPTTAPTTGPTTTPTTAPTTSPTTSPSPTASPTHSPTHGPTHSPTSSPTQGPTTVATPTSSPGPGPGTDTDLPDTGSNLSLPALFVGAGLLLAGLALLVATRSGRRRQH